MRTLPLILITMVLGACSPAEAPEAPPPGPATATTDATGSAAAEREPREPVADDLTRLGRAFIAYALGRADRLPVAESLWIGLDGQRLKAVDDMPDPLTDRRIWRVCPGDAEAYAAFSCPLDILSPLRNARSNGLRLVLRRDADVLCARADIPAPHGRYVVIRPAGPMVSCASDFALVLHSDPRGGLTEALMTVSEP